MNNQYCPNAPGMYKKCVLRKLDGTLFGLTLYPLNILKINENAALVFSISFQHGHVDQNFVFIRQFYFNILYKILVFVLIEY